MRNHKHIAIFSAYYPPHLGGVELYTRNLAKELVRAGNEVSVITSSFGINLSCAKCTLDDEVNIYSIPSKSVMGDRFPLILPGPNFASIFQTIKDLRIDHIVINTRYYPLNLLGCRIAKIKKITPLIIDHSSGPLSTERNILGLALRSYERGMNAVLRRQQPATCSVSEKGLQWLNGLNFMTYGVVHNAIDIKAYRNLASVRDWRSELSCKEDTMLIVFAGRLIPEKGVLKAIEAVNRIASSGCSVRLAIAGDGDLNDKVQSMQNQNVRFVGRLAQPDLSALLRDADCFCLPTDYPEGLPTILLEAGAWGNSIVTSNCAGAREVIPNGQHGTVLKRNDIESLEKALRVFYSDESFRTSAGKHVERHIEQHFSWQASANDLMRVLDSLP